MKSVDLTPSQKQAFKLVNAYIEEHQAFEKAAMFVHADYSAYRLTSENPDNPAWDQLLSDIRWACDELRPKGR
jgi:serine/threonine-protein kinase RIO1